MRLFLPSVQIQASTGIQWTTRWNITVFRPPCHAEIAISQTNGVFSQDCWPATQVGEGGCPARQGEGVQRTMMTWRVQPQLKQEHSEAKDRAHKQCFSPLPKNEGDTECAWPLGLS